MARKAKFKLYDVLVRLSGSRYNEVGKLSLTAPEVMILGSIHGPDSIVKPVPAKNGNSVERSDSDERARLIQLYEGFDGNKRGFVQRVFGPSTIALPRTLPADYEPQEQMDVQVVPPHLQEAVEPHAAMVG